MTIAFLFLLQGVGLLGSWNEIYGPTGRFVVDGCESISGRIGARAQCRGALFLEDGDGLPSSLVGPRASFGSAIPESGAELSVYYRAGDPSVTYPSDARPTELARVIVGLVPLFFIATGLACWLLGWVLTRGVARGEGDRHPDDYSWPARFVLQPRGAMWAFVGFAWLLLDRFVIGDMLGSAGLG
jgi:hypothetical protein